MISQWKQQQNHSNPKVLSFWLGEETGEMCTNREPYTDDENIWTCCIIGVVDVAWLVYATAAVVVAVCYLRTPSPSSDVLAAEKRPHRECSMTKSHVRYVWLAGWVGAHDDGVIITDSSQQANRQIKLHTQNNCKAQRLPLWRELWLLVCLVHGLKMVRHMLCYLMYLQLKKLYSERRGGCLSTLACSYSRPKHSPNNLLRTTYNKSYSHPLRCAILRKWHLVIYDPLTIDTSPTTTTPPQEAILCKEAATETINWTIDMPTWLCHH